MPDSKPNGSARQDAGRRIPGRPAQAASATQIADPEYDTEAGEHKFAATQIVPDAARAAAGGVRVAPTPNWRLVKQSFAAATSDGVAAAEHFYARLFAANPGIRALFPTSMVVQRPRMLAALSRVIWSLDNEPECASLLRQLGREHRRYGVLDKHCDAFFAALRDTVQHDAGTPWTAETSAAWERAVDYLGAEMRAAIAATDATPAWWIAEIVGHELRGPGVAVLRLRTDEPLPYQAGQYVPVQVARWSRTWRPYSVATAPRPGGPLELHVRAVPGGLVSNALVHHSDVGECVLLGAAEGTMTLADPGRDLLCIAGGTGLAPLKAIIEGVLRGGGPFWRRKISLWFGARTEQDLYDLPDLRVLESICPGLKVIPVVSHQPEFVGMKGMLSDVTAQCANCEDREVFISGPERMVRETARRLASRVGADRIHHDPPDVSR